MPDHRQHRGAHPEDQCLWEISFLPILRAAVSDLSWLLSRGYAGKSSLKIVGDRYGLQARQREALSRCACSDEKLESRISRRLDPQTVQGRELMIDAFNVITTIEVALSGGVVLEGRDGCFRDIAGVHGTYRQVQETIPALHLLGAFLQELKPASCCWLLDQPVSNSGRLRQLLLDWSDRQGWGYRVELTHDPDKVLIRSMGIIASSDSQVLDACREWFNLVRAVVEKYLPKAWIIPLGSKHHILLE